MDKWEKRMNDISEADKSEWQRTVEENQELKRELRYLGERFGLPLGNLSAVHDWKQKKPEEFNQFSQELAIILGKHNIRKEWRSNLFHWVTIGKYLGIIYSMGFPTELSDGNFIIHPDTDLKNPYVQELIQRYRLQRDPPPQPQPVKGNSRQKDWRPVWEWSKRHPEVTYEQLAKLLDYNPVTIRRKMAELNEEIK